MWTEVFANRTKIPGVGRKTLKLRVAPGRPNILSKYVSGPQDYLRNIKYFLFFRERDQYS